MEKKQMIVPIAGLTMAVGAAAIGMAMKSKKKPAIQKSAGRAIKAVGEAVEHFHGLKM